MTNPIPNLPALIGGPYAAPRCRPGRVLGCLRFGDRAVSGLTDAPVPWPYSSDTGGKQKLFLIGDLVTAVKSESEAAVAHHWGVPRWTVSRWRRILGVERFTEGTSQLWRELSPAKLTPDVVAKGNAASAEKQRLRRMNATSPTPAALADRIRSERIRLELTQDAAAELLGISRSTYRQLETSANPTTSTLLALIRRVGMRLDTLLPELVE